MGENRTNDHQLQKFFRQVVYLSMETPSNSYEVLRDIKNSIEASLAGMLAMKKDGKRGREARELTTEASVKFLDLRQVNRSILQEEDRVKSETESLKAPLDHITLELHNLLYEKNYYMKAINTCKDFKSKYPHIHLVPEEEFFRDAPAELKADPMLKEDSHKRMLQRLHFELYQRKGLREQRELLEARKKMLQESIAGRKKLLCSLPSHLKAVKRASLQVQLQLGMLHMKRMKQHQVAELLPPPLYVLYSQLVTEKEASGESIDVEIIGSAKEAQTVARQMISNETGSSRDDIRNDEDAAEEEDDSQRRRKRVKRPHERELTDGEGSYNAHPLALLLHIYYDQRLWSEKQNKPLTLRFEFLQKMNVVCVGIETSQGGDQSSWLVDLFPDGLGLNSPSQAAGTESIGNIVFDKKHSLRPYKWAQQVAGMDFLADLLSQRCTTPGHLKSAAVIEGLALYRQQQRVRLLLQELLHRRKALLALKEQLDLLFKLKMPPVKTSDIPWAPQKPQCGLRSWTEVQHVDHDRALSIGASKESGDGVETGVAAMDLEGGREDGELPYGHGGSGGADSYHSRDIKASPSTDRSLSKQLDAEVSLYADTNRSSRRTETSKQAAGDQSGASDGAFVTQDSERQDSSKEAKVTSAQRKEMAKSREPAKNRGTWENNGEREFRAVLRREGGGVGKHFQLEAQVKISVRYPSQIPVFRLAWLPSESGILHSLDELQDIERQVNDRKGCPVEVGNSVLAHQLALWCKLFDDYVDRKQARRAAGTEVD